MTPEQAKLIALRTRVDASQPKHPEVRGAPHPEKRPGHQGAAPAPAEKKDARHFGIPHPRPNTVHIAINARTGDITFHPSIMHVAAGKPINWVYTNGGPFTIHFEGQSPFGGGHPSLHSVGYKLTSPSLPQSAVGHRFRYGIAARVSHGQHQGKIAIGHGGGTLVVSQ